MICGVKLRKLRRKAAEALEETKENLDMTAPYKRARLDHSHLLRSDRRKVFGLTLTDSRLASDTLTGDLCANTDLTQFQGSDLTQFLSPSANTYQNFSLNESSHIYNELMFDSHNSSISLDSDQYTFDATNDRTLISNRVDVSLASESDVTVTSVTSRSSIPGRSASMASDSVSVMSDKTFLGWTEPRPVPVSRRFQSDLSVVSDVTPTRPQGRKRRLTRANTISSTPKVQNSEPKRVQFVQQFACEQNQGLDDKQALLSDFSQCSHDVTVTTEASSSGDITQVTESSEMSEMSSQGQSSVDHSQLSANSVLGLGHNLSDTSLARVRRKAFRVLSQSRGSVERSDPEGGWALPLPPTKQMSTSLGNHGNTDSGMGKTMGSADSGLSKMMNSADSGLGKTMGTMDSGLSKMMHSCSDCGDSSNASSLETTEVVKNRGQLKLGLSVCDGVLSVHVMEARSLQSRWNTNCSAYIQTSLVPDEKQCTMKRTATHLDTNQPQFGEKITYDVKSEDQKKRLMVSCWSKDSTKNCGEFLGCMSFGIKHLISRKKSGMKENKDKEGWYYLLSENMGHRKHLEAPEEQMSKHQNKQAEVIDVMAKLDGMQDFSIVVARGYLGYGFTVKGNLPVRVGRVKECGAAEDAGLKDGDVILRINTVDVTRATTELVAEMIRTSVTKINMDIRRTPEPIYESIVSYANSVVSSGNAASTPTGKKPTYENAGFVRSQDDTEESYIPWQPHLSIIKEESNLKTPDTSSPMKTKRKSYNKWTPDISEISALSRSNMMTSLSRMNSTTTTIRDFTMTSSAWFDDTTRNGERFSSEDESSGSSVHDMTLRMSLPRSSSTPSIGSRSSSSRSSSSCSSWQSSMASTFSEPADRESAIQKLLSCEESYTRKMHRGIQKISRPLRHKILNVHQHKVLFQNLEKLVAMSDFTLRQLLEKSYTAESSYIDTTDDVIVDVIGQVYKSRVKLMCEAYETYHAGLCKAFTLLGELNQSEDFCKFSKKAECKTRLSLGEFLERPARHLANLAHYTQRVLRHTFPEHEDHRHLSEVVNTLKATSKKIQGASDLRKSRLQGSKSSLATSMVSMTTTSSVASSVASSVSESLRSFSRSQSLIDPELVAMQSRLTFAKDVQPFQLLAPSRHLVYAGELEFVINEQQTIPLWGVLCSDLLLLTTKDEQGNLVVVDDPLYLQDTVHHNFTCQNATELMLVLQNEALQRAFRLRCPSVEQKWAWKNIMEQRINACQESANYSGLSELARM